MLELEVIEAPAAAALALDPIKSRILAELGEPASAASLASRIGLSRQKVNYHLRALETWKLVEPVQERLWGGLRERLMVATASSYVVSPAALGELGADPSRNRDRFSAGYLIALAARVVREVGELWKGARQDNKRLATLSIDTCIQFASPVERASFTQDLSQAVNELVQRYHNEKVPDGRPFRLLIASYPAPPERKDNSHADSSR